jgi:hypothetical protein
VQFLNVCIEGLNPQFSDDKTIAPKSKYGHACCSTRRLKIPNWRCKMATPNKNMVDEAIVKFLLINDAELLKHAEQTGYSSWCVKSTQSPTSGSAEYCPQGPGR